MDRVKRFTGMAKGASKIPVRRDEDESLVLFGDLYKHEKERDMNLLEPMFSVEFEAVQGDSRMFKLPSGKRDYFLPDGEKHDYVDWLKTPPATPLFPSLEMEANSSQMIFQKELPILQPVRTSRFSSNPDTASASTTSGSPTSSSTKSVTPTARPSSSSSKKSLNNRGAAAPSKEQDSAYRIDKRSSYTPLTNRQHNSIPSAPTTTTTATKASKKASGNKPQPSNAVKNVARPDKASKNVAAPTTKPRSNDSSVGAKDKKVNAGTTRRLSCPPSATTDNVQATSAPKGRSRASTGAVPATRKDAGATDAVPKRRRKAGGRRNRGQSLEALQRSEDSGFR